MINLFLISVCCLSFNNTKYLKEQTMIRDKNFVEISSLISFDDFERLKNFILKVGDKKTHRSFDCDNPHYRFDNFDVFLGADIGQRNPYNDPEISDFNQLTIYDPNSSIMYYELIIVRKGDIKNNKYWIEDGMKEGKVYLVDVYNKGLATMKNNLPAYLEQMTKEMKSH